MVGSASTAYIYETGAIFSIVHGFALHVKNFFVVKILAVQTMWIYLVNNADNSRLFHACNHVELRLIPATKLKQIW